MQRMIREKRQPDRNRGSPPLRFPRSKSHNRNTPQHGPGIRHSGREPAAGLPMNQHGKWILIVLRLPSTFRDSGDGAKFEGDDHGTSS
ncbi:hypothetical protein HPP92_026223, partial [Vanilla planifolia]